MHNRKKNALNDLELLDKKIIERYVEPRYKKNYAQLIILDEIASTNTYLAELLKSKSKEQFLACIAESQTAGRGRLGRNWFSPYGCNIYLSIYWHFPRSVSALSGLSLVVAVAVVRALTAYGMDRDISVKWPNDVLWRGRKLAGILVEFFKTTHDTCDVIVGVGLNVNMPRNSYDKLWCDVSEIINGKTARNKLVGLLFNSLVASFEEFQEHSLSPFLQKWCLLDVAAGKQVTIITPQQQKIKGIGCGIDNQGCFVLKRDDGTMQKFAVGDVSLRMDI